MSELQVIHNPLVQPISLADAVGQWSDINNRQAQTDINRAQEQRLTAAAPMEQKTNELKFNAMQHTALKSVATDYMSALERQSQKLGIAQNSPQYQQLADSMYANGYNDTMRNITGKAYQAGTNIDLNAMSALAGLTPAEENAQQLQQKVAEAQAVSGATLPDRLQIARAQADIAGQQQQTGFQNQVQLHQMSDNAADRRQASNQDFELHKMTTLADQTAQREEAKANKPPPTQRMAYIENNSALKKIDLALDAVKNNGDALGFKNMLGDTITQRLDPNGVATRALIADIGSLKIHDRSGAAVTASESPRLMPFIPQVTDTPETVTKKLTQFKTEYQNINNDLAATYKGAFDSLGTGQAQAQATPQPPAGVSHERWAKYLKDTGQGG